MIVTYKFLIVTYKIFIVTYKFLIVPSGTSNTKLSLGDFNSKKLATAAALSTADSAFNRSTHN